jgi:anaerobic dimethyl sulfoxide reductase subunit A
VPTFPFFCGKDCGGNACPLLATVENGRVTRVVNNPAGGRYIKGCSRGFALPTEQNAPGRILTPLIRTGPRGSGCFREAAWEEALTYTAGRLADTRARCGASSVLCRASAGVLGALHGTPALLARFMALFGGCTRLTGNYSYGAAQFILPFILGREWKVAGFDAANMQYSEMIILWGANVLETRQGPEVPQRLMEAKKRGAQIVSIEPRRSATVAHAATWWLPCRPGTDAALMLAVLYVMLAEALVDRTFIEAHSVGFQQLERYVLGQDRATARSPGWAEGICGIPAEEITRFARAYAAAKPTMLFPGYSIQRVFAGEETYRLTVALQIATGNFGQRGGSTGAINAMLPPPRIAQFPVPPIEAQPSLPVVRWPDAILQGRAGGYPSDIRAAYNLGSNFLNQGGDIRKGMAAFEKLDFAVTHEVFLTPTARYCDVVFPTTTAFEKEDIGIPWAGNYLLYKPQVVSPMGQARSDYDVLCDLADRLGFGPAFSEGRSAGEWVQHFIAQSEITDSAEFRRTGIYLAPDHERVGLGEFADDPVRHPLSTPSGKVEIASEKYHRETGFPAIPTWQAPPEDERYPLRLITPKSPHRTHSQGSNIPELRAKAPHALSMHPRDASARGIADGEPVHLFNSQGAVRVPVVLSADVLPGVVSLPEGIWVELDASGVDLGGATNMFTATDGTAPGVACIMHGVAVEVTPGL